MGKVADKNQTKLETASQSKEGGIRDTCFKGKTMTAVTQGYSWA